MNVYTFTKKAGKVVAGLVNTGAGSTIGLTEDQEAAPDFAKAIKRGELVPYGDYRPQDEEAVEEVETGPTAEELAAIEAAAEAARLAAEEAARLEAEAEAKAAADATAAEQAKADKAAEAKAKKEADAEAKKAAALAKLKDNGNA